MSSSQISLARRIIQANDRLHYICLLWYRGQMNEEDFRKERKEILQFIEEAGKSVTLVAMPVLTPNQIDNTGSHPVVS